MSGMESWRQDRAGELGAAKQLSFEHYEPQAWIQSMDLLHGSPNTTTKNHFEVAVIGSAPGT